MTSKTILAAALVMLSGCGGLTDKQVSAGRVACVDHGGVDLHWVTYDSRDLNVWCVDGTKIVKEYKQ